MEMPPMTGADYDRLLEAKEFWWEENDSKKDARIEDLSGKILAVDRLATGLIIPLARKFPTWNLKIGQFAGTKTIPKAAAVYIFAHNNVHGILVWQPGFGDHYLATISGAPHGLVDWGDARKFETREELYGALQNVYNRLW